MEEFAVRIEKTSGSFVKKFMWPVSNSNTESVADKVNRLCRGEWDVRGGSTKNKHDHEVEDFEKGLTYDFNGFEEITTAFGKQPLYELSYEPLFELFVCCV